MSSKIIQCDIRDISISLNLLYFSNENKSFKSLIDYPNNQVVLVSIKD